MLAGGSNPTYRTMLATGGTFLRRLEVWRGGVRIDMFGDDGVTIIDGSLSANLDNRVTRKIRLTLPASLYPSRPGDLLDPLSDELVLWCGWEMGAGPPLLFQAFLGPVTAVSKDLRAGTFSLDASDRVEQIVQDRFTSPVSSGPGHLVTTRIKDLISDSQPGAVFGRFDETYAVVPSLTWEADRAQAIDDLATNTGCHWYQLPDGSYTVRRIPWSSAVLDAPVVTYTQGVDLLSGTLTRSRTGVYTAVQVTGEAANGDPPVVGYADDDDPASPTYIGGPLGRRVLQVQADSASSNAQANSLARQRLMRSKVQADQLTTNALFDPSLELGDVATLITEEGTFIRALAGLNASLRSTPTMTAQWRAPGGAEE